VCACPIESENSLGECVRVCILNAACMFHSLFAFLLFTFYTFFAFCSPFFCFFVIYFSCAIVCALLSLFFWSAATSTAAICDPRTDRCSYSAVCSAVAKKNELNFCACDDGSEAESGRKLRFFRGFYIYVLYYVVSFFPLLFYTFFALFCSILHSYFLVLPI